MKRTHSQTSCCYAALKVFMVLLTVSIAMQAKADDVPAGSDMFITPDRSCSPLPGPAEPATYVDFGIPGAPPIPADFFGPGSDPFSGRVCLKGAPLDCGGCFLAGADTIVERLNDAVFVGGMAPVNVQIRALRLVTQTRITVTFNGGLTPSEYDVSAALSEVCPQQIGSMAIHHTFGNGGTFESDLPVTAKLVFTKFSGVNGANTVTLDPPDCSRTEVFRVPGLTLGLPGYWSHFPNPGDPVAFPPGGDADHDGDGVIVEPGSAYPATTCNFIAGLCPQPGSCAKEEPKLTTEEAFTAAHSLEPINPDPVPQNPGACCDHAAPGGVCTYPAERCECIGEQQEFFKGLMCDAIACEEHTGACCDRRIADPALRCRDGVAESLCIIDDPGQVSWIKDASCVDLNPPCTEHTGACCVLGVCTDNVTESQCTSQGSEKWYKDTPCSDPTVDAICDAQAPNGGIPTVSEWGLVILALTLLVGAKIYYRRRKPAEV